MLFAKLADEMLSTCMDVCGCGCLVSSNVILMGTNSYQFMYPAPISVSAADSITFLIIFEFI